MEKKIIFLELPTDVIEKIDDQNKMGSRSIFISNMVEKKLQTPLNEMQASNEVSTSMHAGEMDSPTGEINLVNNKGVSLGKFNINTTEGFEKLSETICEISDDPIVRMKARHWR